MAKRSHEEHDKIDEQSLVLKVQNRRFGPALQFKNVHTEAVGQADEKGQSNRCFQGELGQFEF